MRHRSNFFHWCIGFLSIIVVAIQIPVHAQSGINEFGSFEQQLPSYWTKPADLEEQHTAGQQMNHIQWADH